MVLSKCDFRDVRNCKVRFTQGDACVAAAIPQKLPESRLKRLVFTVAEKMSGFLIWSDCYGWCIVEAIRVIPDGIILLFVP